MPCWFFSLPSWAGLAALARPCRPAAFPARLAHRPGAAAGRPQAQQQFPGFEDSARKVTITLLDLPGRAYEALEQSAFGRKIKGLTVDKRELFSFAGGIGYLITRPAPRSTARTCTPGTCSPIRMTRQAGRVATFIRVHVPDDARAAYPDAAIRAALRSVTFRLPPLAELVKHLPFKLGDLAGFRVMRVAPPALAV